MTDAKLSAESDAQADVRRFLAAPDRLYSAYIFDLDGTIYLGDGLLPGAKRTVEELRARDCPVRFLSNNPTKDPEQYVQKLASLGLPTPIEEICNTTVTMAQWLLENALDAVVFPIGEQPLVSALTRAGFRISEDPAQIDVVIASYDRTFTYAKLQIAFDAIWLHKRARLVATNPDPFCPFPGGRGEPDCASITAAIEACTSARTEVNVGKPNPIMLHAALKGLEVDLSDCVMCGDRLSTDIRMGLDAGMVSALVLTGESTLHDLQDLPAHDIPSVVIERVDRLLPPEVWADRGWSEEEA